MSYFCSGFWLYIPILLIIILSDVPDDETTSEVHVMLSDDIDEKYKFDSNMSLAKSTPGREYVKARGKIIILY